MSLFLKQIARLCQVAVSSLPALALALTVAALGCSSNTQAMAVPGKCEPKSSLYSFIVPNTDDAHKVRSYYEYAPSNAPTSLIIAIHGAILDWQTTQTGFGQYQENLCLDSIADNNPVLMVYPNGIKGNWATGFQTDADKDGYDDVAFLSALISAELAAHPTIDPRRVYVTGMSNGGFMAHKLACAHPEQIAVVADAAGGMKVDLSCTANTISPVSYIGFHGTLDLVYFYGLTGQMSINSWGWNIWTAEGNAINWAQRNGCNTALTWGSPIYPADTSTDNTSVVIGTATGCTPGAAVKFYKVVNGGHTWPGVQPNLANSLVGNTTYAVNANNEMWSFFNTHPKPASN